jgi:group I intron endonuclease
MVIYKTTNLVNGKFYIGKDAKNKTDYLGSGIILKYAIEKYGEENFTKQILQECKTQNELNDAEIYWIEFYNATDKKIGYNIALGGAGGDTYSNNPNLDIIKLKFAGENNPFYGKTHTQESKDKIRDSRLGKKAWNSGKKLIYSKETLEKMSSSKKKLRLILDLTELKEFFENNNKNKYLTRKHFGISNTALNSRIKLMYPDVE